jgi:acylphosphatase
VARAHVWISGRVQGVFFRHEIRQRASAEGLAGWVRNLPDGRVEAVFEGSAEGVERLVRWCHRGPAGAEVGDVQVHREEPEDIDGFDVRF